MPDPICWICLGRMAYSVPCAWWVCPCRLTVVTDEQLYRGQVGPWPASRRDPWWRP